MTNHEPPRPVLAAVGGQQDVDALLDAAAAEAQRRGAAIVLLHAIQPAFADAAFRRTGESRLRRAEVLLRERLPGRLDVVTELVEGPVVASVVARSAGASMVVLQRGPEPRGRLTVLAHLAGVAARSQAPVTCVPAAWRARDWDDERPVCVGVEPDPASAVVRAALEHARRTSGRVRLVCAPGLEIVAADGAGQTWAGHVDLTLRDRLGPVCEEFPDVDVEVVAWRGRPVDALLSESRECSALVLGRHHHLLPLGSHLGPVVCALLREAECPVVVVDPTVDEPARGTLVPPAVPVEP